MSVMGKALLALFVCFVGVAALTIPAQAQGHEVSGQVVDAENGEPLPGVNVVVQGTTVGTTTNGQGNYSLDAPSADATLVFSFVGYETQEVPIQGRSTIDVELGVSSEMLDEVVVVGYGTQDQADVTTSISTVDAEDMENDVSASVDQALQGRAAGAMVTRNSGRPGGDVSISIRGLSTLNTGSNEPLYVVDGVPINGDSENSVTNPLSQINPQDVESIDILKSASATAIYGSRGSNGVVLITTKSGEEGQRRVSYNASVGMNEAPKKMDVLSLKEYAQMMNQRAAQTDWNTYPLLNNPSLLGEGSDWQEAMFRRAYTTDHSLSVSGGTEDTQYRVSGGYTSEQGIVIESNFRRYSLRVNVDNQTTDWLNVGANVNLSRTNEALSANQYNYDPLRTAIRQRPNVPIRTPEGGFGGPQSGEFQLNNPVGLAELNTHDQKGNNAQGQLSASVDFTDNLTLTNELNVNASYTKEEYFEPTWQFGVQQNDRNESQRSTSASSYWQVRNYLNYVNTFQGLDVDLMTGHELEVNRWEGLSGSRQNFPSNSIHELGAGDGETATNNSYSGSSSLESFFGRGNLSYDNRYLLTGNFRADASSSFPSANRWGYFPSFSLAWRVMNEPFLEGSSILDVVNQFKLRGGWGYVGNQNIGGYRYGDTYSVFPGDFGNAVLANNLGNPTIQWEATESINLGLDVAFFDQRVTLTVDAYRRQVQDLLLEVPLPYYAGASGEGSIAPPLDNIGEMTNRGLELTLNTVNVEGDFQWESDIVFTMNRNEVSALADSGDFIDRSVQFAETATRTVVGEPAAQFYGYVADGVWQNGEQLRQAANNDENPYGIPQETSVAEDGTWVGDLKFRDLNRDGVIDEQDRTFIGNPTPDFQYGFTNRFNYKSFDLSVFVNGSYGNKILNQLRRDAETPAGQQGMLASTFDYARIGKIDPDGPDALENLEVKNPETNVPRVTISDHNNNQRISTRFIEDGTYLRIKNITFGYTLPNELAQRLNMRRLRIYTTVQNAYTFTGYSGYDPEVGAVTSDAARDQGYANDPLLRGIDVGRYPTPRTFTVGINLGL